MAKHTSTASTPRPFLKWAGGKRALMDEILTRMPDGPIELYVEPFLGGGAVFLELARQGRIRKAILNDRNPELVATWSMVRDQPEALIEAVRQWDACEATYYHVRDELEPAALDPVTQAARVVWLNRTCFNGLYRKNRSGHFNVPFGRYKSVNIDEDNLRAVSAALANVVIYDFDFESILEMAGPGAVVYCDPPYWPVSKTASFNCYDGLAFGVDEQERLAGCFAALPDQGAYGILSNSWTDETLELYERHGLYIDAVEARRSINSKGSGRGPVPEVMATTHARRVAVGATPLRAVGVR
jgi:DNA adenine methylase